MSPAQGHTAGSGKAGLRTHPTSCPSGVPSLSPQGSEVTRTSVKCGMAFTCTEPRARTGGSRDNMTEWIWHWDHPQATQAKGQQRRTEIPA